MFAVQVSHKMIVSNLFQLERDVDFPIFVYYNNAFEKTLTL